MRAAEDPAGLGTVPGRIMGRARRWALEQLPDPGAVTDVTPRVWLAATIVHGPRPVWSLARQMFRSWTLLPGDRVYDVRRDVEGIVVHVQRPSRVEVVWARRMALHRHPDLLEHATRAVPAGPPMAGHPLWRATEDASVLWRIDGLAHG